MNVEEFRDYCLSLPGVTEKMPFTTVNDPYFNQDVPDAVICQLVRNSYGLIVEKLTEREREEFFHL